ncbi:MAG: group 1 truncated hemoglobin [Polyangiales bacterium]
MANDPDTPSLYDRLGGETAMMSVVVIFYEKVLADPVIGRFFTGLDMRKQIDKQLGFLSRAFDGPVEYRGRALDEAHARLVAEQGLNDEHFDRIARLLEQTLVELSVERPLIDEALAIVGASRALVLRGTP